MNRHEDAGTEAPMPKGLPIAGSSVVKDPVCGMDVPADAPLRSQFGGLVFHTLWVVSCS